MPSETPPPTSLTPSGVTLISESQRPLTPLSVPPTSLNQTTTTSSATASSQNLNSSQHHLLSNSTQIPGSGPQQFCLRWNNYQSNLTSVFDQLLQSESFVDVTLACDNHSIKAHKMVLSACSPYFQALFFDNPCQHPIIIMRDVKWPELKAAVEFMYKGEINVCQDQIGPLLRVAEMLKIRGLADVNGDQELNACPTQQPTIIPEITTKKPRISREWEVSGLETLSASSQSGGSGNSGGGGSGRNEQRNRKRRWPSTENSSAAGSPIDTATPDHNEQPSPIPQNIPSISHQPQTPTSIPPFTIPPPLESSIGLSSISHPDEMEIKPGIAEMIREEERVSFFFF